MTNPWIIKRSIQVTYHYLILLSKS